MRKLSLLIAMFLIVTIGGVYATWSYAGTDDIADAYAEVKVTITDAELTGANGTYKIESNLALIIDQKDGTNHEAELIYQANDSNPIYLRITFTPSANAPVTIKQNAVKSELYFGTTVDMKYSMDAEGNYSTEPGSTAKDIFKFFNVKNGTLNENIVWGSPDGEGKFVVEYDLNDIKTMIMLNDDNGTVPFVLDTKAEHDAFRTALAGNIVARVTDGTVTE